MDLKKLKELAEKAMTSTLYEICGDDVSEAYYEALPPNVVLELIKRVEELEFQVRDAREYINLGGWSGKNGIGVLLDHINTLLKRVEELEGKLSSTLQKKCAVQMELKALKNVQAPVFEATLTRYREAIKKLCEPVQCMVCGAVVREFAAAKALEE